MKKNTWLLIALIAVIFTSGAATGFFAGRLTAPKRSRRHHNFSRSSKERRIRFQQYLCKRLKLTEEQKKSTQAIISNWLDEMGKLRQLHAPQYLAAFNDFYDKMAPILNNEQKKELEKWRKKFTKKGDNNVSK